MDKIKHELKDDELDVVVGGLVKFNPNTGIGGIDDEELFSFTAMKIAKSTINSRLDLGDTEVQAIQYCIDNNIGGVQWLPGVK